MEEIREETGIIRDEQGKFLPGVSGNPYGRPPGSGISITTEIKKKLQEIPEGKNKTYLHYLIEQILKKAVIEGDQQTIKQIWNYIDGMPQQNTDITSGGKPLPMLYALCNNDSDTTNTPNDQENQGGSGGNISE